MEDHVALDTETDLIAPGLLAPPLVCVSVCDSDFDPVLVDHMSAEDLVHELYSNHTLVGANIAYDSGVIVTEYPRMMPVVLQAYREGRVLDVQLAEQLHDISLGTLGGYTSHRGVYVKLGYSLAALHERHGLGALSKADTYRLRYGELRFTPVDEYPTEAKKYAKDDAVATLKVHFSQQTAFCSKLEDLPRQTRSAFALHLMSMRGIVTDKRACQEYLEEVRAEIDQARELLTKHGLVRPDGRRNIKAAQKFMLDVCEASGAKVKLTDAKQVSLDAEACRDVNNPVLNAYALFTSAKTTLQRTEELQSEHPQQTRFTVLVNNGRTASSKPSSPLIGQNFQNLPRGGKMRQVFCARPGFLLCSVDFNAAEIATFAQCELWITGKSVMAEAVNEGKDLHCMVAAQALGCSYEEALANKRVGKYKVARDRAKVVNFGGLGGLGAETLMKQFNKAAKSEADKIDLTTAKHLLNVWFSVMQTREYFAAINAQFANSGRVTIQQFKSCRWRGQLAYTELANTLFSGLAADAGKAAMCALTDACFDPEHVLYGSRPLLYIHDEIIAELPKEKAHECAFAMRDIMVSEFQKWVPDVKVSAEPALMKHWFKSAEAVFDTNGRLRPWTPADDPEFKPSKYLKAVT